MRIEVKGRNLQVTDDMREVVARRFEKVDKQVSDLATLEVELSEERNPANPDHMVAEATLHGTTSTRSTWSPTSSRARSSGTATSAASGASSGPGQRRPRRPSLRLRRTPRRRSERPRAQSGSRYA